MENPLEQLINEANGGDLVVLRVVPHPLKVGENPEDYEGISWVQAGIFRNSVGKDNNPSYSLEFSTGSTTGYWELDVEKRTLSSPEDSERPYGVIDYRINENVNDLFR